MKTLTLSLFLAFAGSAFGSDLSAVDSLTSFLRVGYYVGANFSGECSVYVSEVSYPLRGISVTVTSDSASVTKLVEEDDEYTYRAYKNEFIQTDTQFVDDDKSSYIQQNIRTVNANNNKLYVVTSYSTVFGRQMTEEVAECVIDL